MAGIESAEQATELAREFAKKHLENVLFFLSSGELGKASEFMWGGLTIAKLLELIPPERGEQ